MQVRIAPNVWPFIDVQCLYPFVFTDVTNEINDQIATNRTGRMFAIVQVCGKQFKVTENDIIIIEGFWPPNIGDRLKLEKVLLVGSTDFTLVGRPILNRELVSIDATVIEKALSHTKTRFRFRKRKQYRRINCKISWRYSPFSSLISRIYLTHINTKVSMFVAVYRVQHTMLRINSININGNINEKKEVEGLDRIY